MNKIGNRKSSLTSTNVSYIPLELLSQILARLPVKTLLKFRCVCKSWCSLIDSPDFTYMHLNLFNNNRNKTHLLFIERNRNHQGCSSLQRSLGPYCSSFSIHRSDTLRKTAHLFNTPGASSKILGSCDGLFLLRDYELKLRLWNPSIRKSLLIPFPPKLKSDYRSMYRLGFAPSTADYKVVAFRFLSDRPQGPQPLSIAVYSLSDNIWKVTDYPELSVLRHSESGQDKIIINLKGAAYWLIGIPYQSGDSREETHVAEYNFDDEKLTYFELPGSDGALATKKCLCLLGECLAFFSVSSERRCIWLMKKDGASQSWSLWFSGDSYDFATQEWKWPTESICRSYTVETYLESLVLWKGCDGLTFSDFP